MTCAGLVGYVVSGVLAFVVCDEMSLSFNLVSLVCFRCVCVQLCEHTRFLESTRATHAFPLLTFPSSHQREEMLEEFRAACKALTDAIQRRSKTTCHEGSFTVCSWE